MSELVQHAHKRARSEVPEILEIVDAQISDASTRTRLRDSVTELALELESAQKDLSHLRAADDARKETARKAAEAVVASISTLYSRFGIGKLTDERSKCVADAFVESPAVFEAFQPLVDVVRKVISLEQDSYEKDLKLYEFSQFVDNFVKQRPTFVPKNIAKTEAEIIALRFSDPNHPLSGIRPYRA